MSGPENEPNLVDESDSGLFDLNTPEFEMTAEDNHNSIPSTEKFDANHKYLEKYLVTEDENSKNKMKSEKESIIIAGAGLVGATAAAVFADAGHDVNVYELRQDPRDKDAPPGRSINLTVAHRGRQALRRIGIEEETLQEGIKMYGRMIHKHDGETYSVPYGRTQDHFILSISRLKLNQMLITAAEKRDNVKFHFQHRVQNVDLEGGLSFSDGTEARGDILIGADGAFSKVRAAMARNNFNYEQMYIPHGYKELNMTPVEGKPGVHRMPANYLHIWPRHQFMLIALPNKSGSFTCTIFMPFKLFKEIETEEGAMAFMQREFPSAIPIFGEENLRKQFGPDSLKALPLVTVKCSPHNWSNSVIVGDASHAIVPFYGQGMNAGMEDIEVLYKIYEKTGSLQDALEVYGEERPKDAHAIADLALYNYIEMRDLVTSNWFLFRKKVDNLITTFFPRLMKPLYEMTVFTPSIPYSEVISRSKKQSVVIDRTLLLSSILLPIIAYLRRDVLQLLMEKASELPSLVRLK